MEDSAPTMCAQARRGEHHAQRARGAQRHRPPHAVAERAPPAGRAAARRPLNNMAQDTPRRDDGRYNAEEFHVDAVPITVCHRGGC